MESAARKSLEWNVQILAACLIVGVAVGLASGLAEARAHEYLALGFRRNLLLTLRGPVLGGAATGLKIGALWVGVNLAVALFARRARGLPSRVAESLGLPVSGSEPVWALCLALLAGLAMLPVVTLVQGEIGVGRAGLILLATLAAYAAFRFTGDLRTRRRLLAVLAPGVVIFVARFDAGELARLWSRELAASLGSCLAVFAALHLAGVLLSARQAPAARSLTGGAVLLLLLAPLAVVQLSETGAARALTAKNPKNVILIGIDTLRADRVAPSAPAASGRATAPHLAALAERGTLFHNAISQAPWTLPAFASILTGKYPREHGAVSWSGGRLAEPEVTLAEILRESGYQTAGVVSHFYVAATVGLDQGFHFFSEDNVRGHWQITSRDITDEAIEAIETLEGRPFFLFVHYFDPHYEYRDHDEWAWADGWDSPLLGGRLDIRLLRRHRDSLTGRDLGYLAALYDEEVAYTDREVGRLLDFVTARGLDSETAIVVVADHGEELMERGWLGHMRTLFDELIRVPLIAVLPTTSALPGDIAEVVETRAIFPTLLDYLGIDWKGRPEGSSLLPLLRSGGGALGPGVESRAFSEVWIPEAEETSGRRVQISAVRTGDWKYVRDHRLGSELLLHLATDPMELENVQATHPEQVERLRQLLDEWLERMPAPQRQAVEKLGEETLQKLRALGYL